MPEEYSKNGDKTTKVDYKKIESKIESPILTGETAKRMETYKAKTETASTENAKKPEIKREGEKRCWCGSGTKFEDCHGKHLRVDKNPGSATKEYEHKLNVRSIDEYDTPESVKEYEEKNEEKDKFKEEDFLRVEESGEEKEENNEYKKKEDEES